MKKIKGFTLIEGLLILVIVGLLGGTGWYVWNAKENSDKGPSKASYIDTTTTGTKPAPPIPEGYIKYENKELSFSFAYPKDWTTNTLAPDDTKGGAVVSLVSLGQKKAYEDFVALQRQTEGPNSFDLAVSYWSSINNAYARGGSWIGMKDQYSSLNDYFNDTGAPKHKIDKVTINGTSAYEVELSGFGGQTYGLMFERPNGIYEFSFINVSDKSQLTDQLKKIIATIKI